MNIDTIDGLIKEIMKCLPCIYDVDDEFKNDNFTTNPDQDKIFSTDRNEIETLANLFDQLYEDPCVVTGYYDPDKDKENLDPYCEADVYTGLYWLGIDC